MAYAIVAYEVPVNGTSLVAMPKGARILSIAVVQNVMVCWAIADLQEPVTVQRRFLGYTSGSELPSGDPGKFLGTLMHSGRSMVMHWFDGGEVTH